MLTTLCPSAANCTLPISYTSWLSSAVYHICFWTNFAVGFIYPTGARMFLDLYCSIYRRLTHVLGPQTGLKPASSQCWSLCILAFYLKSTGLLICLKLCVRPRALPALSQHKWHKGKVWFKTFQYIKLIVVFRTL